MDIMEHYHQEHVTISLLLTRRCNFACSHCFYECGPSADGGYMSSEVLNAVHDQVLTLKELDIYPTINLIGGEPTLDLDQFERILERVMGWGVPIEMTTNGWWFHEVETAQRFFEIVAPYVDSEGYGIEGDREFSVRISNDRHHDQFRPTWLQHGKLSNAVQCLWECDERGIFYTTKYVCYDCGEEYETWPDDEICPGCEGNVDIEDEPAMRWIPPMPAEFDPWLYVQPYQTTGGVIPIGRASNWGSNDAGAKGYCHAGMLSYLPGGTLMDICCKGSWCEFGTVWDNPLVLLELGRRFVESEKPTCSECRECAETWKAANLEQVKSEIESEIEALGV